MTSLNITVHTRPLFWLLLLLLGACSQDTVLDRISRGGELLVGTRSSPTTAYMGARAIEGPEYEMAKRFAQHLGLKLKMVIYPSDQQLLQAIATGQVHMAAAGLAVTSRRQRSLRFSTPYDEVTYQLLYRRGTRRPEPIERITNKKVVMAAGSPAHNILENIPKETKNTSVERLIADLDLGLIEYTVANSNQAIQAQRYHANILTSPIASDTHKVAWAFSRAYDDSLIQAANAFIAEAISSGAVTAVLDRYYNRNMPLNYVDRRVFWQRLETRLPAYKNWFLAAEKITDIDWRLLAAVGYQESHWNPAAVSPTGVQGIMMLTRHAAKAMGVTERTDPEQSILGGARYLLLQDKKIPARIGGEDRIWFTLAAYNVGYGHLEDARILTQRQGGDPDRWADVKSRLPLLSQEEFYNTVKYGYARGREPVSFVRNIRFFYELLVWWDNQP